jgi:hypothetical protein|tara:strand:+ start:273 stop:503 length:231 start_codon:yes stop_codon:yes gene_type:complete
MPLYDFENRETEERFEKLMSYKAMGEYLIQNPHIRQIVGSPRIVSGVGTNIKVDDGFREAIARVKETHRVNNIPDY